MADAGTSRAGPNAAIAPLEEALASITALHRAGELQQAREACHRATAAYPGSAELHFREGLLEAESGNLEAARAACERALAIADAALYRHALGDVLDRLGDRSAAIVEWRRAVALQPSLAAAHGRLGVAAQEAGDALQAVEHFRLAAEHRPGDARAWNNLAAALLAVNRVVDAEAAARRALDLEPARPLAAYNLGRALRAQGRLKEASQALESAVLLDPRQAGAWDLLGSCRLQSGALLSSREAFASAVAADPSRPGTLGRLASSCLHLGQHEEAIAAYRRAEALRPPDAAQFGSSLLVALQYDGRHRREAVFEAHRAWAARYAPDMPTKPRFCNLADPERRLRIGYVSPRFHRCSAAFLHAPVIERHDRTRFEVHCYAQQDLDDDVTARIRASGVAWTDARPFDDAALAARLREDGIDIAMDLAGHTPGNRLTMFVHGPAPVTGTWLDYFNTTGMGSIDFLVTDPVSSPEDDAQPFTERLARLPSCRYCWEPPDYAPAVEPPPLARGGKAPVFGAFSRMAKLSSATLDAWCALLRRVPAATLVVKSTALGNAADHAYFSGWFRDRGVDPARIDWRGASGHAQMLAEYAGIDVALDTFPYNGGLTTLEALWMGRPVVTIAGDTLVSRQSRAILAAMGMPDLCAPDSRAFVDLAAALVDDGARLGELSSTLRARLQASPLLDHAGFTRDLERVYREEWKRRCASLG